jgi:XTP/dITP diphosphohydrolase
MTKVPLVYASTNRAKIAEARRILAHFGIALDDLTTAQVAAGLEKLPQIVEPESTYEGNALEKAVGYARMLRRPCLSDDSGVEIQELGCLPGVYTANFGFTRVKDALTPDLPYAASFVCCVAYAEPTGRSVCVTERLNGFVRFPPNAQAPASSVPYSYFFIPEGGTESLAVLTSRPGEFLSHRGMALSKLCHSLGLGTGD